MKKNIIKRRGSLTTYYLQSYWGIFPIGRKIRYKTFETLSDGRIKYTRYVANGHKVIEEGEYSDQTKQTKVGLWSYRKFENGETVPFLDVFYTRLGKKNCEIKRYYDSLKKKTYVLTERFFYDDRVLTLSFNVDGCIVIKKISYKNKRQTDAIRYDEKGNLLEKTLIRNLPLRFKEESFQLIKRYKDGRLNHSVLMPKNLKEVSIIAYYNEFSNISHYDYWEQNHLLMRTDNPEQLHRFLVAHHIHCKKDDKARYHMLQGLRQHPTLSQKKNWMRQLLACQGYER